jgi:hypothetical protein
MAFNHIKDTFDIDEMLERQKSIDKQAIELAKKTIKANIQPELKRNAPVEDPNIVRPEERHLKDSIKIKVKRYEGGNKIVVMTTPNYNQGYGGRVAHLQEFGHRAQNGAKIPGKAWWAPSIDKTEKATERDVQKGVREIYRRVSG